jgi:hypothetical protein
MEYDESIPATSYKRQLRLGLLKSSRSKKLLIIFGITITAIVLYVVIVRITITSNTVKTLLLHDRSIILTIVKVLVVAEFLLECLIVLYLLPAIVFFLMYYISRKFIKSEEEQELNFRTLYMISPLL